VIDTPTGMFHIKPTDVILNFEGLYKILHQETELQKKKPVRRIRIYCYKFYTGIACGKQRTTAEIAMMPYLCNTVCMWMFASTLFVECF
jgi:hypothetical protein